MTATGQKIKKFKICHYNFFYHWREQYIKKIRSFGPFLIEFLDFSWFWEMGLKFKFMYFALFSTIIAPQNMKF